MKSGESDLLNEYSGISQVWWKEQTTIPQEDRGKVNQETPEQPFTLGTAINTTGSIGVVYMALSFKF